MKISFGALLPLFVGSALANTRGIPIPFYRFKLWGDLDGVALGHAATLEYIEATWNLPGDAEIEASSYGTIAMESAEQASAIDGLGFTEDVWDCYVNHYGGYDWEDMVLEGVVQYWEDLGWTEDSWLGNAPEPASNDKVWDEFSPEEETAAIELCYTKELWNEIALDLWPELPNSPAPTPTPSAAPSVPRAPSSTLQPTLVPVVPSMSPSAMPTANRTQSPTRAPTTLSPTLSMYPTMDPTGPTTLPPAPAIDSVDEIRYVAWEELTEKIKNNAMQLAYTDTTWNEPGTASVEGYSFAAIDSLGIQGGTGNITDMGLTEAQWDCYMNHYEYNGWGTLEELGVQVYFRALGWNEDSWNEIIEAPATEEAVWANLTGKERNAAESICFRMETWDMIPLPEWVKVVPTASPVVSTPAPVVMTPAPVTPAPVMSEDGEPTSAPVESSSPRLVTTMHVLSVVAIAKWVVW